MMEQEKKSQVKQKKNSEIKQEKKSQIKQKLFFLILKAGAFVIFIAITFFLIFGISRCGDNMMSPAFKDGDIVLYYRLEKEYAQSDAVVIEKDGEIQVRRIVAKEGDTVDITENGLLINGYAQQEKEIFSDTLPYTEGITFPITLKEDEYFVLGDNRTIAKDSRVYGVVKDKEIKGSVITLIRRRGL